MKKGLKRFFLALTVFSGLMGAGNIYAKTVNMNLIYDGKIHAYSAEEVKIKINGNVITNVDVPPLIINDRTMVPARAVFEELGAEVAWNESTKEVYMTKGTDLVVLKIDSNTGYTNGLEFKMDTPAKIVNDRTMIPVRAASEALGCTVGWNDSTRTVTINSSDYKEPSEGGNSNNNGGGTGATEPTGAIINVTGVTVPQSKTSIQEFTVKASGVIEKYDSFMLEDNRIVLDIYNANNQISNSSITTTNSAIVSCVRSGQNQTEPTRISRVVFDLTASTKYTVKLSNDKKNITISFDSNKIMDIVTTSKGSTDYITVYGKTAPVANVFTLSNPDRLVLDFPNTESELDDTYSSNLNHVDSIRTGSPETGTTRVVLQLNKYISYTVQQGVDNITIMINKSTLDNILYDSESNMIILKNQDDLEDADFDLIDKYLNKQYIINLSGNYESTYGYGTISVNNEYVSTIEVKTVSNKTQLVINENAIVEVKVYADNNEIRIKVMNPKDVYDKIVVLDAGHGKSDPGTSGNGLVEKEVNLDILLRVYDLFETDGRIKVYLTREDDSYPTNISRAQMANQIADLFVSIHQNAAVGNPQANGTEVLYTVHATDVNGKLTSQIAAQFMQNYVVSALGTTNRGIKKRADLIVLNQTTVPAILIETVFLSNESDAAMMKQDATRDKVAKAIYSGIVDMMNQYRVR